jgi:predicted amidophosphoribosyltransferase
MFDRRRATWHAPPSDTVCPDRRTAVVKPAWGMKRTCQGCGAHFYDLQKDPIICPKCATVYDPDAVIAHAPRLLQQRRAESHLRCLCRRSRKRPMSSPLNPRRPG